MTGPKQYNITLTSLEVYLLKNGDYSDVEGIIEGILEQILPADMIDILKEHETKDARAFIVHGREYLVSKDELADEVPPKDLDEIWESLERR